MLKRINFFDSLRNYFDEQERRLVFRAFVTGAVVWAVVFALKTAVHDVSHFVLDYWAAQPPLRLIPLVLGGLALGALVVAALARFRSYRVHYRDQGGRLHELIDVEGDGLERAISLYHASEPAFEQTLMGKEGVDVRWQLPTFSLVLRKFAATVATLGSGGSGGLEASVTLIGESMSAGLFKPRRRVHLQGRWRRAWHWWQANDPDNLQTAQLSGIAAAVSTLLGAPFAAAFFATEVMYRRRPIIEKLVYSLIASLVAFFLNNLVAGEAVRIFDVTHLFEAEGRSGLVIPPLSDWRYYAVLVGMTVAISLVSVQFGRWRGRVDHWFHHGQPNIWLRHLTGALVTGVIALLVWGGVSWAAGTGALGVPADGAEHALELVLGTGERPIEDAIRGDLVLAIALVALAAKMVATLATIGSGGSAGLLIPSIYFGTMIATIFHGLFLTNHSAIVLVVPAMTASLVSIVNVPMAAILFAVEVFSGAYMVPALIALVTAAIFTHQTSIYRTQRETFERRQILPGYSVRRVAVPLKWDARTLRALDIRKRHNLNVIGWVEQDGGHGVPRVRPSTDADVPLGADDILVVLGKDEDLDEFVRHVQAQDDTADQALREP